MNEGPIGAGGTDRVDLAKQSESPAPVRIEDLPDYASLAQLRRSLHGTAGGRRAAVLVGAGFSRNAQRAAGDAPLPPLWPDFSRAMQQQLEPGFIWPRSDALRLAEEFRVVFGRAALEDLIRQMVPDGSWSPGVLHRRLLRLPWTDVLTTNWDTLLERAAAQTLERQYGVVRTVGDMASARSPRVIKLHGSLPSHSPFILTEEDYRRYPSTHASFVNLARQVFIENELMLLGFSGDDPNFLEWAGWVRDQLQDQSRRLYIVGVFELSAARRQLLLSKNIVPIDLAPLVNGADSDQRHGLATEQLLTFLQAGSPPDPLQWPTLGDIRLNLREIEPAVETARALLSHWRGQRLSYPGWLICPHNSLSTLRMHAGTLMRWFESVFSSLPVQLQTEAIRELAWISLVSGLDLPPAMRSPAQTLVIRRDPSLDSEARLDLARALLLRVRFIDDDAEFEHCAISVGALGVEGALWRDFATASRHLNRLDFAAADPLVARLRSDDPVWKIRRASLSASLGDQEGARTIYLEALSALRERQLREPTSLWIRSRVRWAESLAWMSRDSAEPLSDDTLVSLRDDRPMSENEDGCDPHRDLERLGQSLEEEDHRLRSHVVRRPRFDSGVYYHDGRRTVPSSGLLSPQRQIRHVLDELGLTGQTSRYDYFRSFIRRFATTSLRPTDFDLDWILFLADSRTEFPLIERYLSRGTVATLAPERVQLLRERIRRLINHGLSSLDSAGRDRLWSDSGVFWIERLNAAFEALSRLATRCSREEAMDLYAQVLAWSRREALRHWWLHESYALVLKRVWQSVHPHDHSHFSAEHVLFPMPIEVDDQRMRCWPEPLAFHGLLARPVDDTQLASRIQQLVEMANMSVNSQREPALLRLQHASDHGLLTASEQEDFGRAFWSRADPQTGVPQDTGMFPCVAMLVPNPDNPSAPGSIRGLWALGLAPQQAYERDWMFNTRFAVRPNRSDHGKRQDSGTDSLRARNWLDYVLSWPSGEGASEAVRRRRDEALRELGWFLCEAVFPYLSVDSSDETLREKILRLCAEEPEALISVASLARRVPEVSAQAQQLVRTALWSPDRIRAKLGALAAYRWLSDDPEDQLKWSSLASDIVALCGMPRHPSSAWLWHCARRLAQSGHLDEGGLERLILALSSLQSAADFAAWDGLDPVWEEEAPLALREATRTALALRDRGVVNPIVDAWVQRLGTDPMPEVRYADLVPEEED